MTTAALIDGDIIAYKHASVAEVPTEWDEDLWTLHAHLSPAIARVDEEIEKLKQDVGADSVVVALSDKSNFRKTLYPEYKANRTARKPILLPALREHLSKNHSAFIRPGLEADDILGILATHSSLVRADRRVIVSIDKDFLGVPCELYRWNVTNPETVKVTPQAADKWHMVQTLTGDTTDNYPGCPGIGPKKADAIVEEAFASADPWSVIVAAFLKAGLTEADALLQARLARILRGDEYDFKTKQPVLWSPAKLSSAPKKVSRKSTNKNGSR